MRVFGSHRKDAKLKHVSQAVRFYRDYFVYKCFAHVYMYVLWGPEVVRSPGTGVKVLCKCSDLLSHLPSTNVAMAVFIYYYCVCAHMGLCGGQRTTSVELGLSSHLSMDSGIKLRLPHMHGKRLYPQCHSFHPCVVFAITSVRQHFLIGFNDGHVHPLLSLSCSEHSPAMTIFSSHIPYTTPAQPFCCLTGPQALCPRQII